MRKIAFVFPGQGSQYVGMGKDFAESFPIAKRTYQEANEALGIDIEKICFEGPKEELFKTQNTQPAILATSVALYRVLDKEGFQCDITAGLSLGEYTALVISRVMEFSDAVRIVKNRGKYMQQAVPMGIGGMAAVIGLDKHKVNGCLTEAKKVGLIEVANYNGPYQIVFSGEIEAVKEAIGIAKEQGAEEVILLPNTTPFHTSLLRPAAEKLRDDLKSIKLLSPVTPIISNVNAKRILQQDQVADLLVEQISKPVLWQQSIELMINDGAKIFIEIGPGKTLISLIKKIARNKQVEVKTYNVENIKGFNYLMKEFNKN